MRDETKAAIIEHASRELPREACGYLLNVAGKERYFPCRNIAHGTEHFTIHPKDHAAAEKTGDIIAVVHSHPYARAAASDADKVACERSRLPWHIVGVPTNTFATIEPSGFQLKYIGREWSHGVLDCYTLVKDWYEREMKIFLPEIARDENWWHKGQNLYIENFEKNGFYRIDTDPDWHKIIRRGDGLLIQHGSDVPNHAAIYLGGNRILHHIYTRLSTECVYGGYWQKHTTHVLRHHGTDHTQG